MVEDRAEIRESSTLVTLNRYTAPPEAGDTLNAAVGVEYGYLRLAPPCDPDQLTCKLLP